MALPTFDVDATALAYLVNGVSLSDLTTQIDRWVQQASGDLDAELRMLGLEAGASTASGYGSSHGLYVTCQRFIEAHAGATLLRAITHQNPAMAVQLDAERHRLRMKIRDQIEGLLGDDHDENEHLGSFRSGRTRDLRRLGAPRSLWKKGGKL